MTRNGLLALLAGVSITAAICYLTIDSYFAMHVLIGLMVFWAVAIAAAVPILYKRSLQNRNRKDLTNLLMANPAFRDTILDQKRSAHAKPRKEDDPAESG
jgi:hypothetical protein